MSQILAGIKDLMFRSKVKEVAAHYGTEIKFVRDPNDLLLKALSSPPRLILLDLDDAALSPVETIAAIRRDEKIRDVRIIGFLSHTNTELAKRVVDAGCNEAMPRSEFTRRLPEILKPPEE